MKIAEVQIRNIVTKSNLPDADFVINPYIGCAHSCIYCYARFMKRFTGHEEKWGQFVDVKINCVETISSGNKKMNSKSVFMSSVTDPYQKVEEKYQLTRNILRKIVDLKPNLSIQTKSVLILRDIDILKKFSSCQVGMTITTLDERIRKEIEPNASSVEERLSALKQLKENGLQIYVFIGPILPLFTDWKKIIEKTNKFVDLYMFENLNMYGTISKDIFNWIESKHANYLDKYRDIHQSKVAYWEQMKAEIEHYCNGQQIDYKMYFNHKIQKKNST